MINNNNFVSSWDSLQNALDELRLLKQHYPQYHQNKVLLFFENQLTNLEKLYPYNVFFSIGFSANFKCSICGQDIDSFECEHLVGKLYSGKIAYGIPNDIGPINHIAIVDNPRDKRCTLQYDNSDDAFKAIKLLSDILKYKNFTPLNFHNVILSKPETLNKEHKNLKRNDRCYCRSGKKFKNCCIGNKIIINNHAKINLFPIPSLEILDSFELSGT